MDPSCFIHGNIFESFFSSKWTINKISKETRIVLNFIIKHRINRTIRRIIFPNIFYSKNTRVHWKCTHEFSFSGERTSSLVPEYFPFYTNKCKVWRRVSFERKKEKKKYWKNKRRKESFQVTFFAPEIFPFLLRVSWRTWRTISPRRREDKEKRVSTRDHRSSTRVRKETNAIYAFCNISAEEIRYSSEPGHVFPGWIQSVSSWLCELIGLSLANVSVGKLCAAWETHLSYPFCSPTKTPVQMLLTPRVSL